MKDYHLNYSNNKTLSVKSVGLQFLQNGRAGYHVRFSKKSFSTRGLFVLLFVDIELLLLTQGENRKMKGSFIISFYLLLSEYST